MALVRKTREEAKKSTKVLIPPDTFSADTVNEPKYQQNAVKADLQHSLKRELLEFTEFKDLKECMLKNVPYEYHEDELFDFIKILINMTVKITVRFTSLNRPEFIPNTIKPYPCYNSKGKRSLTHGTGWVSAITMFPAGIANYGNCPCPACICSEIPHKEWCEICVQTTREVVFDDLEARQSFCDLWFDDDNKHSAVTPYWHYTGITTSSKELCELHYVTHDIQTVSKLWEMYQRCENLFRKVMDKLNCLTDLQPLTVIVSHNVTSTKQFSVGFFDGEKTIPPRFGTCVFTLNFRECLFPNILDNPNSSEKEKNKKCLHIALPHGTKKIIDKMSEEDLPQSWIKNPGFSEFVPVDKLITQPIFSGSQQKYLYDFVEALVNLAVRITVNFTSLDRPDFVPHSSIPYPGSFMKGKNFIRSGTGRVHNMTKVEHTRCQCPECEYTDLPEKSWWEVTVQTSTHVIFDAHEARNCICRLWFDGDNSPAFYLCGRKLSWSNYQDHVCGLSCATHDLELVSKLWKMKLRFNELCNKVCEMQRFEEKISVIVNHPNGLSKQVSVGYWVDTQESPNSACCIGILCTCPGSSGA